MLAGCTWDTLGVSVDRQKGYTGRGIQWDAAASTRGSHGVLLSHWDTLRLASVEGMHARDLMQIASDRFTGKEKVRELTKYVNHFSLQRHRIKIGPIFRYHRHVIGASLCLEKKVSID